MGETKDVIEKLGPTIIIGGPPGVGTTTVALAISKEFKLNYFSTGEAFREVAVEKNVSLEELNKTASKEIDEEIDRRSRETAQCGNVVMESDLAAYVNEDVSDVSILLTASLEKRAERIFNDEKTRTGQSFSTLEEVRENTKLRRDEDARRWLEYYQIDIADTGVYDYTIDTEELTLEEVINKVKTYVKKEVFNV